MKMQIEKVDNGMIATYNDEIEEGVFVEHKTVFEELDTEEGEAEAARAFLSFIQDHFGIGASGDRYAKHRVRVNIERGDKYVEPEEDNTPELINSYVEETPDDTQV